MNGFCSRVPSFIFRLPDDLGSSGLCSTRQGSRVGVVLKGRELYALVEDFGMALI
jgi:hypothetical protein